MRQQSVLISSACAPGYLCASVSEPNHRRYAALFGMARQFIVAPSDMSRGPSWDKLPAVKAGLEHGYDWVFHIDADAVFATGKIDLRTYLPEDGDLVVSAPDPAVDLVADPSSISTGTFAIRNTPWAMEFIKRWMCPGRYYDPGHPWAELRTLHLMYKAESQVRDKIRVVPTRSINGHPLVPGHYEPGDLVVHPSGRDMDTKMSLLRKADSEAGF